MTDTEIINWLEAQAKISRTGISFDWVNHAEDGQVLERGFRFMRKYHIGEPCSSIREAVEKAVQNQHTFH